MVHELMRRNGFELKHTRHHGTGWVQRQPSGSRGHVALFAKNQTGVTSLNQPVVAFHYDEEWEMLYEERFSSLANFLESRGITVHKPAAPRPGATAGGKRPFEPVRFIEMMESTNQV